jgi:multiple sugar transport system permease protein
MSTRRVAFAGAAARHAVLLVTSLFALLPFLWMAILSMKSPGEMFGTGISLWPRHFHALENYTAALIVAPLPRFLLNGVFVCGAIIVLQLLICVPCAYALAKLRFAGSNILFTLVLVALMLPHQVLALPLFVVCYKLDILNRYAALILPFIVSPFGIFLLRQFFKTIPDDVVHAARLDGLSELGIVWRIMVPMTLPAVVAFVIFSAVTHWNDLFWPLIAVRSESLMPPARGIVSFRNDEAGTDYGPLMAGAVLVVAPLVLAFLFAQRRFIEGLTIGSVK